AQDQDRALARGQALQRRDERQLDALAALVASLGTGDAVLEPQQLVGVRLDPRRLDQRRLRAVVGIAGRAVVDREDALGPALDHLEARVGDDRVQPRAQRAAPLEAAQPAPCGEQRILECVL